MSATVDQRQPADSIVSLRTAFDMIGRYVFASGWPDDMAKRVRLGQRDLDSDRRAKGRWVLKALRACVRNGWLPLFYFAEGRRIRYFENPNGYELWDLYPQPVDGGGGQIELGGGTIYSCEVDVADFSRVLRRKFGKPGTGRRGRPSKYPDLPEALDLYFTENSTGTHNGQVVYDLGKLLAETQLPKKTALHDHINRARERALERARSGHSFSGKAPDGRG